MSTTTAGATWTLAARDADIVVEGTYRFPMVTQFAIEPHAFIAAPDGDGVAVWSSIQHPNWLQRVIAGVLGMPLAKVRIFAPDPGGGFGGKQHAKYEPLIAFMALKAGRPVRLVLTFEETFQAVRRGASEIRVRTGFRRDGGLVFRDVEANYLIGAYADIADRTVGKGSYTSGGPYLTPAVRILARSVLSHTTPSTAFRGFGNPQQIWAVESNMDEAAHALGIDPLELRLRNLAKPGDAFIPGDRRPMATGLRPSGARPSSSGGGARRRPGEVAASRSGSSPVRRPVSRTPPSACSPTAVSSSTRARPTWARALGRSSPRSLPRSSALRSTGSPSSWATRRSCRTTSRRRRAGRQC